MSQTSARRYDALFEAALAADIARHFGPRKASGNVVLSIEFEQVDDADRLSGTQEIEIDTTHAVTLMRSGAPLHRRSALVIKPERGAPFNVCSLHPLAAC